MCHLSSLLLVFLLVFVDWLALVDRVVQFGVLALSFVCVLVCGLGGLWLYLAAVSCYLSL